MTRLTKDQARAEIAKLVAQFEQNEATLLDKDEAMIENNFIRPLFRALNWNVDNRELAEPQWEFVLQRTTREGNRPDYILQLDGQALFVMDAKKAKYSMRDPRWLNQVYAYAYSTQNNPPAKKIDFAILTDFQELIVLDCTLYAAKPAAVDAFRVMDWTYRDYVARFDELWELFERDNVLTALRERATGIWARYLSPKKVKANRVPPDRAFLSALDDEKTGWRVRLAKDMKKRNPELRGDVLTAAVQLLIDRIVFVKVLSDREIEDDYLAQMATLVARDGLAENDCGWFVACKNLFAELNAMYNGSIFAPRPELEAVTVSNAVVRAIIEDLLPENSPYNFAMLPVEILGTIYERFLGRVVHATDARVKIEDKPEVRKAGGVYYTPQYIVDYIVSQTVGKLLAERKTPADVAQLKILDPACGSGSFLLGAYDALIEWHIQYYQSTVNSQQSAVNRRASDAYYRDEDGRVRLTAKLKRQILVNNLFGVDIDPQAVEVTRLSLSLKALEDTRSAEAHHERTLFNQTLLPDLSANIQCGNSLIGADYLCVDDAELKKVKPFDWARAFPGIFYRRDAEGAESAEKAYGFDAVIGNPPYGASFGESEAKYFREKYEVFRGVKDVYTCFIESSVRRLDDGGRFSFIIPSAWLGGPEYKTLRTFLLRYQIDTVILLPFDVFADAYVDTAILVVSKSDAPEDHQIRTHIFGKKEKLSGISLADTDYKFVKQGEWHKAESQRFVLNPGTVQLLDKIRTRCRTTFDGVVQIKRGVLFDKGLLTTKRTSSKSHRYFEGDVYRYELNLVVDHWVEFDDRIKERPKEFTWFEGSRLLLRRLVNRRQRLMATFATETFITNKNLYSILPKDNAPNLWVILGVLNSRLISYLYINQITQATKDDFPQVTIKDVLGLPFPDLTDRARHDRIVARVEQMLALHKSRASAQTETDRELYRRQIDATDREIDALVYQLYDLSAAEIAIVEGK
jgi:type I restriction-modification system DNA methylase subunit